MSRVEAPRAFEMNILSAADFMKTVSEGGWHPVSMQTNFQNGEYKVKLAKTTDAKPIAVQSGMVIEAPAYDVSYQVIEGLRICLFNQIKETIPGTKLDTARRTLREIEEFVARQDKPTKHFPKGLEPAIQTNNAVTSPILSI